MSSQPEYRGRCFCGAVEVVARGEPAAMGYCHCESCRHWSAGPVNAFTLWPPEAVEVVRGEDQLAEYSKTPASVRQWCGHCGGHVLTRHPKLGLIDIYAALLPELGFQPGVHVHYQEAVLRIHDGLPKQRDVPSELGGSGELVAE
ncbi:GFA family protein [Wenzhouxiangella sp. EGI_FJ10305]|uniref:GFA family protein n=1 Tax=Wenzhouxiangella sp. EGI_FJ10305 TaxID=3243768 RepID=UPI0035E27538